MENILVIVIVAIAVILAIVYLISGIKKINCKKQGCNTSKDCSNGGCSDDICGNCAHKCK